MGTMQLGTWTVPDDTNGELQEETAAAEAAAAELLPAAAAAAAAAPPHPANTHKTISGQVNMLPSPSMLRSCKS